MLTEAHALRREIESLRERNAQLEQQLGDAKQAVNAFAVGEVDAVALDASSTPILLQAAQLDLRRSQGLLRAVFDGSLDAILLADDRGQFVDANGAACEMFGQRRERLLGLSFAHFTAPDLGVEGLYEAATRAGRARGECRLRRADGTRRTLDCCIVANIVPGLHLYVLCDITERMVAETALRASEERLARIIEGTSEGIWTYDELGIVTFANGRFAEMLGYAVVEIVGHSLFALLHVTEHIVAKERLARRKIGVAEGGDVRFRRKNGTEVLGAVNANALFGADGRFEGGLVLVTDVSAQRRADETRARLAAIVESSEDAIVGIGIDGAIMSWNVGAEKLHGFSAEEVMGTSALELVPEALREEEGRVLGSVSAGGAALQRETTRCRKDGSTIEVAVTLSPVRDARRVVIGVSNIARDLTARRQTEAALRRTEEQFRQAQKMEAVGRLAGGVAHDFNNLLSVILSYSHLVIQTLKPKDPLRYDVQQIHLAGTRAAALTRQLLAFSRQQVLDPRVVDLNQVVQGMKAMLGRLLGEDIELAAQPKSVGLVFVDPGQVEQVVMNLAVNARDAMPDGGKLTIDLANVSYGIAIVGESAQRPRGRFVRLTVSDTGVGMDAATISRVFEPFFTTKGEGKGTGLGLATVFGIVQQSGGHINLESEPGHGTTFKIHLPRTDQVAEPTTTVSAGPRGRLRGAEVILLVEDEEQVRTVAATILRRRGYTVLEASNGDEALRVAADCSSEIHLLLTDVIMPRMNGRVLAQELVSQRPQTKVLFISGYTDDAIIHHGVLEAGVFFLHKPFSPEGLLRKVREVLDDRQ